MLSSNLAWSCALGTAAIALSLMACASDDDDNAASESTASSSGSGASATGATGGSGGGEGGAGAAGATGAGGAGGAGASGGTGGAGAAGGSGGGPQGNVVPDITTYDFFINCMPAVPPDPINGTFTVSYDNNDVVPGEATITKVLLELDNGNQATDWEFDATPTSSNTIPADTAVTLTHQKVQDSGSGPTGPCSYCGGGSTWTLKVTWDVAGTEVTDVSDTAPVQCAF